MQAAREAKEEYPEASEAIEKDFYMDDFVSGGDSASKTITMAQQVDKILLGAGFTLRKWTSNSQSVLDAMEPENSTAKESMVFAEDGQTSILRIKLLVRNDQFTFVVKTPSIEAPITERKITSCVSQVYDPNGYASPALVGGKIIIQEMWKQRLDWDQEVDGKIEEKWKEYWNEIKHLEKFRINRWIGTTEEAKTKLIGFSDSSQVAYGAVI